MDKLVVLWTTGDKEVALKMVHMYVSNAMIHEWWQDIHLIVWGPSAKLLSEDEDLKESVAEMLRHGVKISACKACADSYNVTTILRNMEIDIQYMGVPLTEYLKSDTKIITF
jgi:hypothetical protein